MRKVIWVILALLVGVMLLIVWSGGLAKITVTDQATTPFVLVYKVHHGEYRKIKVVMDSVFHELRDKEKILAPQGFGLYYDNPQTTESSKLRSIGGCILDQRDESRSEEIRSKGYNVALFPATRALVTEFPMRNPLSILIGILRVYPAIMRVQQESNLPGRPVMEIYNEPQKKMTYVLGYGLDSLTFDKFLK